ncbi:MAG: mechanosensitive ion channel [Proteobacteria bacterium]|nr:mechanosensitive ion channel [Pseudomonadota bacterium]MBK9250753.1 mechanosensitive ion channel [Pseudomonadota bacterium]
MKEIIEQLLSAANLTQLLVIVLAAVTGVVAAHFIRAALARSALTGTQGLLARVLRGLGATSTALVALVVLLVARGLLALGGDRPDIIDTGIQLAAVLLGVRLGVYLLALAMGPRSWIARWESRLSLALWVVLGFALLGWFDFIESSLDAIDLIPGKKQFTLWSLIKGLVVVTLFIVVASLVSRAVESRVMKITGLALSTRVGISKFTYFFLLGLGVLIGINAAGVDLTALTVLTGAVGIGLGFGLQAIASNFVSGFVLLMDKSIKPGDVISFTGVTGTSTENFGWVQELRGRYVVVRDRDGVETLVPNQQLITNPVINWSYSDPRVRLKLPVRISYHDDPEVAMAVLVEAAHCNPRVLREPGPVSRLMHFGDSGIELELRFWIADPQEGVNNVRSDVNRSIWRAFRERGITIPVAQHDVRMVQLRGGGP